jgi:flagellar motor switch protein FliM
MAETLSQSDLDALFGDLATVAAEPAAETGNEKPVTPSVDSLSDNESLSQDQIDELLKQFLG